MVDRRQPPIPARAKRLAWASAALCSVTLGCGEPPSYLVRWKLVDEAELDDFDSATELTTVKQCADVGVSQVRVTTWRQNNTIVDRREYACFPGVFESDDAVEVPALPAGEYIVEVEGLRRTGAPWLCVDDSATPEVDPCVAFAEASVTVAEGSLPTIEVVLLQPPQCDDGIDNDHDGRVDGKDPACILDPDGPESADSSVTLFQISVTFLDSEVVEPANVSVDGLLLAVDGEILDEVPATELDTSQWPFRLPLQTESYDAGVHTFSIVATDGVGNPRTEAFEVEFAVSEEAPGFVLEQFDFTADRFLEPIVEPIAANFGLLLDPADQTGPTCALGGFLGGAPVTIERTFIRVTDEGGQPLDAATLALTGMGGGVVSMPLDEAGGWVSFGCPTAGITSASLPWGSYQLEVEARIGDSVCFVSDGAQDLAPVGQSGAQDFYLQRVVDDQGAPPPGCEECSGDAECSGQICDAGICKDKQP
jgi:hypothetical protein